MSKEQDTFFEKISKIEDRDFKYSNEKKLVSTYINGDCILDVGSGTGRISILASKHAKEVYAFDISKRCILLARKLINSKKIKNIKVVDGNACSMCFKDNAFNQVLCIDTLEDIKEDDLCVDEIYRVLKENGQALFLLPAHKWLYTNWDKKYGYFRRYDKNEFINFLRKKGFRIKKRRYWNAIGLLFSIFYKKILRKDLPDKIRTSDTLINRIMNYVLGKILYLEKFINMRIGLSLIVLAEK